MVISSVTSGLEDLGLGRLFESEYDETRESSRRWRFFDPECLFASAVASGYTDISFGSWISIYLSPLPSHSQQSLHEN